MRKALIDLLSQLSFRAVALVAAGCIFGGLATYFAASVPEVVAQSQSPLTVQPSTGRVGIGTTGPGYTLDVNGTVNASAFRGDASQLTNVAGRTQWTTNGTSIYYSGGSTGIGTSSPTNPLVVDASGLGVNGSPLVLYRSPSYDAFSILPSTSMTYLATGLYFNGGWVHRASGSYSGILGISGTRGGVWYASSNNTASWNLADNLALWNSSGVLQGASSRELKSEFRQVPRDELLEKLARLEVMRWKYKSEGGDVSHIGPVAEDFRRLFRTGDSDKSIALIDEIGVALAGLQAVIAHLESQHQEIEKLRTEVSELRRAARSPMN